MLRNYVIKKYIYICVVKNRFFVRIIQNMKLSKETQLYTLLVFSLRWIHLFSWVPIFVVS